MKITAVRVETLELEMKEPFVIASSAPAAGIGIMMGDMAGSSLGLAAPRAARPW